MKTGHVPAAGLLPYLLLTGTAFCWGGTFVAGKFAVADIPPQTVAAARFVLAWLPLAVMLYRQQPGAFRLSPRDLWVFALLGLTGAAIPNGLIFGGLQYTSATDGTLIQAGLPVMSALLAVFFLREYLSMAQWIGIFISLAGVVFVVGEGSIDAILSLDLNQGNLMVTGAVLSWSVNAILSKRVLGRFSPLAMTTHTVFFGGLFLSAFAAVTDLRTFTSAPGWQAVTAVLFLAIMGNVVGQIWWFQGMRAVGVSRTSVFANLIPLIGVGLAAAMLAEPIYWYHVAGTLAVMGGVTLTIMPASLWNWRRLRVAAPGNSEAV